MGLYDQLHCACPKCGNFYGYQKDVPNAPQCGGIQFKDLINGRIRMTYDYYVGQKLKNIFDTRQKDFIVSEKCFKCDYFMNCIIKCKERTTKRGGKKYYYYFEKVQ
jgi:hypothetical protein